MRSAPGACDRVDTSGTFGGQWAPRYLDVDGWILTVKKTMYSI